MKVSKRFCRLTIPISVDSIDVVVGWNMIGSLSRPVSVTSILSDPLGIATSSFFGYGSSGYIVCDSITPGYGYWVKVKRNGKLILSSNIIAYAEASIKIQPDGDFPPSPPEDIIRSTQEIPPEYALKQAYPTPFNPATTIKYQLPEDSRVILKIYNMLGQVITTLVDEVQSAGFKSVTWNATDLANGIYFYRLEATSASDPSKIFVRVMKTVLMK